MAEHNFVKDRQDVPIWNAIEANNLKQALKLVDKRLAKRPTDYLEALKIYIRSLSPSLAEKSNVLLKLEELPTRKPPLTDLEAIDLYDEALKSVVPDPQESWGKIIGELRLQSVKSSPKDEALSRKCLQACFSEGDLDHARQIAISLEKNFPNKHEFVFWNITMTVLYSKSPKCPKEQRGIFGKLALAQIGKLAAATTQAGSSDKLPIRSVHTPQELLLLHLVTAKYGKQETQLEYLQDPYLGPESIIAKGEWSLWRSKLQLMTQAEQWQESFQLTGSLLKRARTKNASGQITESRYSDWVVWEAYIKSALELSQKDNGAEIIAEVQAEIQAHLDPNSGVDKSWKRNASLAWLTLSFENGSSFVEGEASGRIPFLLTYLEKYGEATTAYNDLRRFAERLGLEERVQLVRVLTGNTLFGDSDRLRDEKIQSRGMLRPSDEDFTTANKITRLINRYKLIYLVTSSVPEYERTRSPQYQPGSTNFQCKGCYQQCGAYCSTCVEILAQSLMQSYREVTKDDSHITKTLLPTDRHPADDLCILAAMCLIKLSFINGSSSIESLNDLSISYILQATALLEYAWSHSKSNFQISLMLVRLYTHLGCGSLAMRAYQRLGVKQIQLDTLSYILFDRVSSFHPHPFSRNIHGSSQFLSPIEHFEKQQNLYRKTRDHVSKNCWLSLENGSYNSIFQIKEFDESISHSMSAAMSVVESRKISRLTQPSVPLTTSSHGYDDFISHSEDSQATFADTNDYESFPNFEASAHVRFGELCQYGLGPSALRTHANLVAENVRMAIDANSEVPNTTARLWLKQHLNDSPEKETKLNESSTKQLGLTNCETLAMRANDAMANIILGVCDREQWSEPGFENNLEVLNKSLYDALETQVAYVAKIQNEALAVLGTLHSLYMAYDLGTTVIKFISYLSQTKTDVYKTQEDANLKTRDVAERLVQTVIEKSTAIKKGLDEGGWIDKVLEMVSQGEEGDSTDEPKSIAGSLKEIIDENFLEEWAGHVLESWRDSVVGFSYFKAPTKA